MNDAQALNPRKLFVGNLSFSITEDQLRDLFAEFGEIVDLKLITDRMTGRSKGFAFVEFATEEAAQAAMEQLNNQELEGRAVLISVARPPAPREDRGGYRGGSGGGGFRGRDSRGGGGGFRGGRDSRGGGDRGGYRN